MATDVSQGQTADRSTACGSRGQTAPRPCSRPQFQRPNVNANSCFLNVAVFQAARRDDTEKLLSMPANAGKLHQKDASPSEVQRLLTCEPHGHVEIASAFPSNHNLRLRFGVDACMWQHTRKAVKDLARIMQKHNHSSFCKSFTAFTIAALSIKMSLISSVVPLQLIMCESSAAWISCSCLCNFLKLPFSFGCACK